MSKPAVAVPLGDGRFRIDRADGTHAIAFAVASGASTWIFLDGRTVVIDSSTSRRASTRHDASALSAPMPGTVTRIHVQPGQEVHAGDVLITLEAMKMELAIRATTDATVTAVHCRPGELVQTGVALVELDPNPEPRTPNFEL